MFVCIYICLSLAATVCQKTKAKKQRVKQFLYRPGHVPRAPRISRQQVNVARLSPLHIGLLYSIPPSLPPTHEIFLVLTSVRGRVDARATMRPKDYVNGKFQ